MHLQKNPSSAQLPGGAASIVACQVHPHARVDVLIHSVVRRPSSKDLPAHGTLGPLACSAAGAGTATARGTLLPLPLALPPTRGAARSVTAAGDSEWRELGLR